MIEILNRWNLMQYSDVLSVLLNYIALGCLAEFDDSFLAIYDDTNMKCFVEMEFPIEEFKKKKLIVERDLILDIEVKMREDKLNSWNPKKKYEILLTDD